MSRFTVILVTIFLARVPTHVDSTFYIEVNSENLYRAFDLRTWLFLCNGPNMFAGFPPQEPDRNPPILCTHLTKDEVLDDVYSKYNFFLVQNPRVRKEQPIRLDDLLYDELPKRLFLGYDPEMGDNPEFMLASSGAESESLFIIGEEKQVEAYLAITNVAVFQEYPDRFLPLFQAFVERVKRMGDDFWNNYGPNKSAACIRPQTADREFLDIGQEPKDAVEKILLKLIDPCFIVNLSNIKNRIDSPEMVVSDVTAHGYCKSYCRFLGIVPRVFSEDSSVPQQCQDLNLGFCSKEKNICWCASQTSLLRWRSLKVKMAECHNHIVTIRSDYKIYRFSPIWSDRWLDKLRAIVIPQSRPKSPRATSPGQRSYTSQSRPKPNFTKLH